MTIQEKIQNQIDSNDIVLYMKGTRKFPQCGFSAFTVNVFEELGVSIYDVNILLDENIRQGIKDFSDWPTIPQLYIKGEFIGGCDIIREMYEAGELQQLLREKGLM